MSDLPAEFRDFLDTGATRQAIYDSTLNAARSLEPLRTATHSLSLENVDWADAPTVTKRQHRDAIVGGKTLARRLTGTWVLRDAADKILDSKMATVARVPVMTDLGTFVSNGTEYAIKNQQRLRPGVYTRKQETGELEAHANVIGGAAHRYHLDPARGVFTLGIGHANIPLYPLLRAMGASDDEVRRAWGNELYSVNKKEDKPANIEKLKARFLRDNDGDEAAVVAAFKKMRLDPEVSNITLGKPYETIDKDVVLAITGKLLKIHKGEADTDDRDDLTFQRILGPEDYYAEHLKKDWGGVRRNLLFKAVRNGNLKGIGSAALQKQIDSVLLESRLGENLEEINTAEILDKLTVVSKMGEGGIPSYDAVPMDARMVSPSHYGFIDAWRTPENEKVGVDTYFAANARKGRDGKLYGEFIDMRTGQPVFKTPQQVRDEVVTFQHAMDLDLPAVPALRNGVLDWVPRDQVTLMPRDFSQAFSPLANIIPFKAAVKGHRIAMASRMTTQALPLVDAEAPFVQNAIPGSNGAESFDDRYGVKMGAIKAAAPGHVLQVTPDAIVIQQADGQRVTHDLYNQHPFNRKTPLSQTPVVRPGDAVQPGQLLARSNFTDEKGSMALGKNAYIAFVPWRGLNYEDAFVVSEGFAKKMASQHMYQHSLATDAATKVGRSDFLSVFPVAFKPGRLNAIDKNGLVKPGTVVSYGDPLVLAVREDAFAENRVYKKGAKNWRDASIAWEHEDPGIVTDSVMTRDGPLVVVQSTQVTKEADKLTGRWGNKGVIARVLPDSEMPHDSAGRAFDIALSPGGVISRANNGQVYEMVLGKIAKKLGRPIKVEDFPAGRFDDYVEALKRQHGVQDTETIVDPVTGKQIPGVLTGYQYIMKLHHVAESKGKGRGGGGYDAEDRPSRGGDTGAKRMSLLETNALLSHGATEVVRDALHIRGSSNEDFWLRFMQGHDSLPPPSPLVRDKFLDSLRASGINPVQTGKQIHIMAMTNKDIKELTGDRYIESGETVDFARGLKPMSGGLFDPRLTGGHGGTRWSAIKLDEPLLNPVFEEPTRRVLGLTEKQLNAIMSGAEEYGGKRGPTAILDALSAINLPFAIAQTRKAIEEGAKTQRDEAVRKLGYLKDAQRLNIHPKEWFIDAVPVLPPRFRPVSLMRGSSVPLVADPNLLYKDLMSAKAAYKHMRGKVPESELVDERGNLYNALKAVVGLGDPITVKNQERQVKGILSTVFGSSPKYGTVQAKLLSAPVDNVGRATVIPDSSIDMDTIGIPEDKAYDVYSRFLVRRLRRNGLPVGEALRHVREHTDLAKKALLAEMESRPVIVSRAPVLHRYGILAFKPQLTTGHAIKVPVSVVKGFGMDFDGDAVNYHVPVLDAAREQALTMLPSSQLLSVADFKTPVHRATQEYVGGLYTASTRQNNKPVQTFRSSADVLKAWRSGKLDVGDPVEILQKD